MTNSKKQLSKKASKKSNAKKTITKKATAKKAIAKELPKPTPTNHNDYDNIPYHHSCFETTNPALLGAIGQIFGIPTKPAENCTFLDIGCAQGFNPLVYAHVFPNSKCAGIDLSVKQIKDGKNLAKKFNINNLDLYHHDVADHKNDPLKGKKFDYIVCHGVFTWVSADVRQSIMQYIKSHLHKNGIAYISYNSLPGWSRLLPIRETMKMISRHTDHWEDKVKLAIEYLGKLSEQKHENDITRAAKENYNRLKKLPLSYIYHEFFEQYNEPLYLRDFIDIAQQHKLSYISDIMLNTSLSKPQSQDIVSMISAQNTDRNYMEQMSDIIYNRQFKSSLLCHDDHDIQKIDFAQHLKDINVKLSKKPTEEDKHSFKDSHITEWHYPTLGIKTESRLHAVALETIVRNFPYTTNYNMIIDNINTVLQNNGKEPLDHNNDILRITGLLSDMVTNGVVTATQQRLAPSSQRLDYPKISDFNLKLFHEMKLLVNDIGLTVAVDGGMSWVIPLCDGTRHINDIEQLLLEKWRNNEFNFKDKNNNHIDNEDIIKRAINERITGTVQHLQEYYLI